MKKKHSLFNSGNTMFKPDEWEKYKREIGGKAEKYDIKHDVSLKDEQLIKNSLENDSEAVSTNTFIQK
ncbi:hypothetical protein [Legionella sp. 16cNR16C]|uniref:hypothetical protein n=1 Tax=Legionella sp. 16cNR16C TaxID=2905656 RepID=UPI001E39057F|nr:hypothetical protein [Legionella sp. 16cNR16C]MCE3046385.1 hypothetical protein [Legionella sp. 16cNR16C]